MFITQNSWILGSNFSITESIFNGTQAFANPTDLASSDVWENDFLCKTPGFNGVCRKIFFLILLLFCFCLYIILPYCQIFCWWQMLLPIFGVVSDVLTPFLTTVCCFCDRCLSQWWWPYLRLMLCHCGRWNPTGYDWCCCHFQWTEPILDTFLTVPDITVT